MTLICAHHFICDCLFNQSHGFDDKGRKFDFEGIIFFLRVLLAVLTTSLLLTYCVLLIKATWLIGGLRRMEKSTRNE